MATPIKPKRSYTATNVPSGLSAGELAVNAADGKVWIGSSDGKSNVLISSLSLSDMAGTTSNVTEGSNLYYTDSRARLSLSAGTGISYDNKTGAITNSSPDQTVVLTAGTGISTSGTYPNFTITNSSPDQTVKLTSGTGISITGTYPEFTITNSSPSSGGTVTSIATTSPITGGTITGSGTIGINASSNNTASYVVQRDASGNFSAGTITATLTGTASTATNLAGGSGGTIPYQSAVGTTAMLSNGIANQILQSNGAAAPTWVSTLTGVTITGTKETKVAVSASAIDLATGNYFTKTISGTTTFTVSNIPASGTGISFILDLTNGGSATINWWSGMKWAGGSAPTLTSAGRDALGFFTHDGGTTWSGLVLGKDIK